MNKHLFPLLLVALLFSLSAFAQEYSYTHYDITDGLAGSTIYCITQDLDGYIWVGTETGLSRFDGTHFKNFTTADGLPDIEILQLFTDSKGRVWMAPFRKAVCYYYKGSIHNQENDTLLKRIRLQHNVESFAEDTKGNVLIQERNALHLITTQDDVVQLDSLDGRPIQNCRAAGAGPDGSFLALVNDTIVAFSGKGVIRVWPAYSNIDNPNGVVLGHQWAAWIALDKICVQPLTTNRKIIRLFDRFTRMHVSFSIVGDSLLYQNELNGSQEYNINTGEARHYLLGREVSRTFRDTAGNLWFTTLGEGLFRLNSDEFRTQRLPAEKFAQTAIYAINRIGHELWVGNNLSYIFKLSLPELRIKSARPFTHYAKSRLLYVDTLNANTILSAGDQGVGATTFDYVLTKKMPLGVKSVFRLNAKKLLMATANVAGIFDLDAFRITDTLWRERSTTVFCYKDSIYIGTLNGLYVFVPGRPRQYLGAGIPFLRKRISSIARSEDGILWISSYDDAGVIGYRNNRVVAAITKTQGLTSDICRTLLVHGSVLWVGTDKGLNKVEIDKAGYPVTRFTTNDGLGSDMVNSIFADSNMIYVGTSAGLSFFDGSKVTARDECRLYLQSVVNSGKEKLADTNSLVLPYNDRSLRLGFAAISYRSVGTIIYRYRMMGLDTNWRETKETNVEYPSLPSGNYEWQLVAVNKFGTPSRQLSLYFIVITPFWKTWWFDFLIGAIAFLLIWMLVAWRIRRIRREQKRKDELTQKVGELESRALQSQMNPHFIFNCLNSIQQFVFDGDILASNKYISGFARLVRSTLHNSTRSFISVSEEVDYLSTYLSLEKMRFKEKMDYFIEIDPAIDIDNTLVPPMLIQPYVENSMRHGLRHKVEGNGYIRIRMLRQGERLMVIIEDNGIGRKKAMEYKTGEHIEYQSKGMLLTSDRIRMIGAVYGGDIDVRVEDVLNDDGQSAGTRVVINLPEF
jgi:ligand-binding sensor domain-containing protein